ncbi:hypothetical protein JCM3766R1_004168 [Sporobolomyces carnicolor]
MAVPSRADSDSDDSQDEGLGAFLQEPEGYRPATPPPTVRTYERRKYGGIGPLVGDRQVQVGLVSGHPLWGHILYPAAIALARFLELHADSLLRGSESGRNGKNVLELGAGGGLPGLVAALEGARKVVITDFPDPALVKNLEKNVDMNIDAIRVNDPIARESIAATRAAGFTWGSSPANLFDLLTSDNDAPGADASDRTTSQGGPSSSSSPSSSKFDLILLSDLVFNHSQHLALLKTCLSCLAPPPSPSSSPSSPSSTLSRPPPPTTTTTSTSSSSSRTVPSVDLSCDSDEGTATTPAVLCFFSHHRPKFVEADLGILSLARENGWRVTKVWEDQEAGPAFPEDDGDLTIRGTVHGFMFTRPSS